MSFLKAKSVPAQLISAEAIPVLVLVVVVRVAGAEGAHLALLLPLRDHLVAPGLQRLDRRAPHHRDLGAAQDRRFCIKEREQLENVKDGIKNLVFPLTSDIRLSILYCK